MVVKRQQRSSFNITELFSHTVHYLLSRAPSRAQATCMDHQWAEEKQPAEADHPRLLHFGSET